VCPPVVLQFSVRLAQKRKYILLLTKRRVQAFYTLSEKYNSMFNIEVFNECFAVNKTFLYQHFFPTSNGNVFCEPIETWELNTSNQTGADCP
jgi:hypothetical protein